MDLTNNLTTIKWHNFIGQLGYEMVGAYEEGFQYAYGVWRSEQNSIMKQSSSAGAVFNAPSRAIIVQRILEAAGQPYSFSDFIAKDVIPATTKGTPYWENEELPHTPPFMDGQPTNW